MSEIFKVAIHYQCDYGYLEYNSETKKVIVELSNEEKRKMVVDYLGTKQLLRRTENNLLDFTEWEAVPTNSLSDLLTALTTMWGQTGVYVDWSRPIV